MAVEARRIGDAGTPLQAPSVRDPTGKLRPALPERDPVNGEAAEPILLSPHNLQLLARYLDDLGHQDVSVRTWANYRSALVIYLEEMGDLQAEHVDVAFLKRFIRQRREDDDVGAFGLQKDFCALNGFHEYLLLEGVQTRPNIIPAVRRRYLPRKPRPTDMALRPCLSVEQMRDFVEGIWDVRLKAMQLLNCKTLTRRDELLRINVEECDWDGLRINLKPYQGKRTWFTLPVDEETRAFFQDVYLPYRAKRLGGKERGPLFLNDNRNRVDRTRFYDQLVHAAEAAGFHDPEGTRAEKYGPHCNRVWGTSMLLRPRPDGARGMELMHVQVLRGDRIPGAIADYYRIDWALIHKDYVRCMPKLGVA